MQQNVPLILHAKQFFYFLTHVNFNTQTAVDAGNVHTWRINHGYFDHKKKPEYPQLEPPFWWKNVANIWGLPSISVELIYFYYVMVKLQTSCARNV